MKEAFRSKLLFETYKREYENFSQLDGESIDAMFSRFQMVVNKM
jgi:hypothetical protein